MEITMVAMGMMQVPINQVIDMVAMRNLLMPASRPMDMALIVPGTNVPRRTLGRIRGTDLQHMLIDMPAVDVMQMSIMQIIGMTVVVDGQMTTARAMLVAMIMMFLASIHVHPPVTMSPAVKTSTSSA